MGQTARRHCVLTLGFPVINALSSHHKNPPPDHRQGNTLLYPQLSVPIATIRFLSARGPTSFARPGQPSLTARRLARGHVCLWWSWAAPQSWCAAVTGCSRSSAQQAGGSAEGCTWSYHVTQQFHSWVYTQDNWKHIFITDKKKRK